MLQSSIGRLRLLGIAEGVSLLLLLFVAMPLKYMAGQPEPVKILGWIHGLLFVLFAIGAFVVYFEKKWPFRKLVFVLSAAFQTSAMG